MWNIVHTQAPSQLEHFLVCALWRVTKCPLSNQVLCAKLNNSLETDHDRQTLRLPSTAALLAAHATRFFFDGPGEVFPMYR